MGVTAAKGRVAAKVEEKEEMGAKGRVAAKADEAEGMGAMGTAADTEVDMGAEREDLLVRSGDEGENVNSNVIYSRAQF